MRTPLLLLAGLSFSICVIAGMYMHISSQNTKIEMLKQEVAGVERARSADAKAFSTVTEAVAAAAEKAKERRDALQISPDADDDSVLDICRGSLCPDKAQRRSDASSRAADSVQTSGNAAGADARKHP